MHANANTNTSQLNYSVVFGYGTGRWRDLFGLGGMNLPIQSSPCIEAFVPTSRTQKKKMKLNNMGEIDTSIVDIASVRLYWQKRSARCAQSLLDHDENVANSKVNNDDADSRASATFTASLSSSATRSVPQNLTMVPSEINLSLFDGFEGENPMVLMAVSSDDCSPRDSSPSAPPPPFQANGISPIFYNQKGVKPSARGHDAKTGTLVKASAKNVQDCNLRTDSSMDVEQDESKVSSFRIVTQNELSHMAAIPDDNANESDEENQMLPKKMNRSSSPTSMRNVFKERPELSCSNNTKAVIPRNYSIPTNSLLFERLERRVGKQVRSRANTSTGR